MLLPRFRQTPKKDRYSPRPAGKTFGFGQKLSAGLAYTLMRDADRITHGRPTLNRLYSRRS